MAPLFTNQQFGPAHAGSIDEVAESRARTRSVDDVARTVRAAIVAGKLAPNERLVELDLARTLDTNRAVVRAALSQLEQQRLVVRERHRGVRVRNYSAAEAAEILETRAMLEGLVARYAAERIDAQGIAALQTIIHAMQERQAAHDLLAYSQLNTQFHAMILDIGQHQTAAMLLSVLQSQAVRYAFRTVLEPGRPARSLAEHEAIFAMLQAHDALGAERAMHAHIAEIVRAVRSIGGRDSFVAEL